MAIEALLNIGCTLNDSGVMNEWETFTKFIEARFLFFKAALSHSKLLKYAVGLVFRVGFVVFPNKTIRFAGLTFEISV